MQAYKEKKCASEKRICAKIEIIKATISNLILFLTSITARFILLIWFDFPSHKNSKITLVIRATIEIIRNGSSQSSGINDEILKVIFFPIQIKDATDTIIILIIPNERSIRIVAVERDVYSPVHLI